MKNFKIKALVAAIVTIGVMAIFAKIYYSELMPGSTFGAWNYFLGGVIGISLHIGYQNLFHSKK